MVDASLLARVQAHDAFFCEMVDLIPPELYLPKDEEEETNAKYYKVRPSTAPVVLLELDAWRRIVSAAHTHCWCLLPLPTVQNKRQAAPKQEKKEASKKGKRVKFDPANMKSVTQLQKVRCGTQCIGLLRAA